MRILIVGFHVRDWSLVNFALCCVVASVVGVLLLTGALVGPPFSRNSKEQIPDSKRFIRQFAVGIDQSFAGVSIFLGLVALGMHLRELV